MLDEDLEHLGFVAMLWHFRWDCVPTALTGYSLWLHGATCGMGFAYKQAGKMLETDHMLPMFTKTHMESEHLQVTLGTCSSPRHLHSAGFQTCVFLEEQLV